MPEPDHRQRGDLLVFGGSAFIVVVRIAAFALILVGAAPSVRAGNALDLQPA